MQRMPVTHVGSLPRSAAVAEGLFARDRGEAVDAVRFEAVLAEAVDDAVARQLAAGVDIVSDGEASKISYATYLGERYSGFDGDSPRRTPADIADFPGYRARLRAAAGPAYRRPCCVGPVALKTLDPLHADIARLSTAAARHGATRLFMNAASPGVVAMFQPNRHYRDDDDYLEALALALRHEYHAIVDAGITLQIDSPDLGLGRHMLYAELDEAAYLARIERHVQALNLALAAIPRQRVRMHVCWGNYEGPHHRDVPLQAILPVLLKARPGALLFEAANPRHAHEWAVLRAMRRTLPDDLVLIPGVIDTTTNFIEHPELVAQRLQRFVDIVGAERVIAGTDCGFGSFAGQGLVDEQIVWAKLAALREGADRLPFVAPP